MLKDRDIICQECMEYVCHHNYTCLDIQDDCPICLEKLYTYNTVYLNCGHKYHIECIQIYVDKSNEDKFKLLDEQLEIDINRTNLREDFGVQSKLEIIKMYKRHNLEDKIHLSFANFKNNVTCCYCSQVSNQVITYKQHFQNICNSVLPSIGTISAIDYIQLYDKYKYRLMPTEDMEKYYKETKLLFKEVIYTKSHKHKTNSYIMSDNQLFELSKKNFF